MYNISFLSRSQNLLLATLIFIGLQQTRMRIEIEFNFTIDKFFFLIIIADITTLRPVSTFFLNI